MFKSLSKHHNSSSCLCKGIKFVHRVYTSSSNGEIIKTGAFKSALPDVYAGPTHFKRVYRSINTIKPDLNIKNGRNRSRKFAACSLDFLMKGLTSPITDMLKNYHGIFKNVHPFEAAVADLVVRARVKEGHTHLNNILQKLKTLRTETSRTAKDFASRANKAISSEEADKIMLEGINTLRDLYDSSTLTKDLNNKSKSTMESVNHVSALNDLLDLQKALRRIPTLEINTLTVVLVGTPNVGKSSIVRSVSTGLPEVNDYPFTTRSVTIGHIVDDDRDVRLQVMDTPGLLDRESDQRNEMERLTFACMAHLPTAVMFVIDPSGLSGEQHSSLDAQLAVRASLRERFPKRPWIDVVSKADLNISEDILSKMPKDYLHVSVLDGTNMDVLKQQIDHILNVELSNLLQKVEVENK
jgi:nucleolar GTP-binding protein